MAIFGGLQAGPSSPPPPPPDQTRLCWGFYDEYVRVKGKELKTSALFNYCGSESLDWHPEPHTCAVFERTGEGEPPLAINGTFRSKQCARFCVLLGGQRRPSLSCLACSGIRTSQSFRMALERRHAASASSKTNFRVFSVLFFSCLPYSYN